MQRYFSHICDGTDVQADWRRSCISGRAPNAIDISQGSLTCVSVLHWLGTTLFIRWFRHIFSRLLRHAGDTEDVSMESKPLVAFYDTHGYKEDLFYLNPMVLHKNIHALLYMYWLCHLRSIAAHRDHFLRRLSVCLSVSQTFLLAMHSYIMYVSHAIHAFLGMLPLCFI